MSEWFKDWFNSPEYLEVYKHRNEQEAVQLINLIIANVNLSSSAKVLDMACGAGRHAILLAEKGYNVTAVDLSENLLNIGKKKAGLLPVDFIHSDIRKYCPDKKFDMIVNLFTSFGYFESDEENFSMFDFSHGNLTENGYFVLDYFNNRFVIDNLVSFTETNTENANIVQKRTIRDERVIKEIIIKNNGYEKRFTESVKLYNKIKLIEELEKRNFKIIKVFGDYSGRKFEHEVSSRIIIISQK